MKNQLINLFALIGIITCVALACSVASDDDEPINPNPQTTNTTCEVEVDATLLNEYGKYQISATFRGEYNGLYLTAINTETGVTKVYSSTGNGWYQYSDAITFTH